MLSNLVKITKPSNKKSESSPSVKTISNANGTPPLTSVSSASDTPALTSASSASDTPALTSASSASDTNTKSGSTPLQTDQQTDVKPTGALGMLGDYSSSSGSDSE